MWLFVVLSLAEGRFPAFLFCSSVFKGRVEREVWDGVVGEENGKLKAIMITKIPSISASLC